MRNLIKQRQKVWFCSVTEVNDGFDRVKRFGKPIAKMMNVGIGAGEMDISSAGIVTDYDKSITSYERNFTPKEGWMVFVDVVPDIKSDGYLKTNSDGSYITSPDYWIYKIADSARSANSRIYLKKV